MPKKIQDCTMAHLISVPLPNHAATYTVISHQFIIDYAFQALSTAGFGVTHEEYRCTADGQIAQGIYRLNFNNDPELSMMFAWTNSYNKQVKFKCVVGAYINKSGSVMISGEVGSWVRKHTGIADVEAKAIIDDYITNAYMYYNQLCLDKAAMETVSLTKRKQSQLLGVLFAEYEILTTEQASLIRDQMKKPQQIFANTDSLWAFYNYVTNALQSSHPKTWMEDQRMLHYFIGTICNFTTPPQAVSIPVIDLSTLPAELSTTEEVVDPLYVIPNQTNILDQIADSEADQIDEDIRYEANDDTLKEEISLEAIDFHNAIVTDTTETSIDDLLEVAETEYSVTVEEVISLQPTMSDIEEFEEQEKKEHMEPSDANLELTDKIEDSEAFDLDFGDAVDNTDNSPDFF